MSTLDQFQRGDHITGPDGTQWRVVDPVDRHETDDSGETYVWLEAVSGGDLWIEHNECKRLLATGAVEHGTPTETDR